MNGGTTELGELLQFILQHGFSVVVAAYLLVRLEKKMTDLTEAITELRHCMEVKVARFEAHLSRNTAPGFSPGAAGVPGHGYAHAPEHPRGHAPASPSAPAPVAAQIPMSPPPQSHVPAPAPAQTPMSPPPQSHVPAPAPGAPEA